MGMGRVLGLCQMGVRGTSYPGAGYTSICGAEELTLGPVGHSSSQYALQDRTDSSLQPPMAYIASQVQLVLDEFDTSPQTKDAVSFLSTSTQADLSAVRKLATRLRGRGVSHASLI